jgi:tetratricopeptide (TPR) repeat protein
MAATEQNLPTAATDAVSPAMRKRLQQCYDRGTQNMQSGNYDYATELLTQCVLGDPGNQIYAQTFLGNLQRKYNNNKKGSTLASIRSASSKAGMMNAGRKKDWPGMIKSGMEVLKINPWDTSALVHIAKACGELKHIDCQLTYLKSAQDADPKSIEIQRECAQALESIGQYDQAISCWSKVSTLAKAKSDNAVEEDANRAVARLQVDKTMQSSGLNTGGDDENAASGGSAAAAGAKPGASAGSKPAKRTKVDELHEQIASNPTDLLAYSELAELHAKSDRWGDAEKVLNRGLEATGGDLRLREQLEDIQLRRAKQNSLVADKQAAEQKTPEAQEQSKRMRAELNRHELDVFRKRVDRYPTNTHWKFELGVRLKLSGNFNEAIKMLQDARNDPKHRGIVLLDLGECFQQIKQYRLAKQHYAQAVEAMPEKEVENRKKALYRAGSLAMGLAEADKGAINEAELNDAEKYLTQLAALDFGYKDVSDRLDKIAQARDKG